MSPEPVFRRSVPGGLAAAAGLAGIGAQAAMVVRSFVPNVSYDPPSPRRTPCLLLTDHM